MLIISYFPTAYEKEYDNDGPVSSSLVPETVRYGPRWYWYSDGNRGTDNSDW